MADMRMLLSFLLDKSTAWVFAHPHHELTQSQCTQLDQWIADLIEGKPLAYIIGHQAFWDLNLKVTKDTLIPRPDTELIVETALELMVQTPPTRILDLGTGSGALALSLGRVFPKAEVMAVDKSAATLQIAQHNAVLNQVFNVQFCQSNWFDQIQTLKFDLIVSNPPYIAEDDEHLSHLSHEPSLALIADQDGLGDFIRIANQAHQYLADHGLLIFEHGWQQQQQVQNILEQAKFKNISSRKDLAGHDRITLGYM